MKVRLLKFFNIPGILIIGLILMALQSTLFTNPTLSFFQPDCILFMVIWLGMKRDFYEGGILTLILGYFVELHSAAPKGIFLCNYMAVFLLARILNKNFQVMKKKTLITVGIGAAIFSRLDLLFILYLLNKADNQWFHTLQLLAPSAIIHGLLVIIIFQLLYRFDNWTLKNPDAERRFEKDFYLDEEPV